VRAISGADIREKGLAGALSPALAGIPTGVNDLYLHLDLDVLDPVKTPANMFPSAEGLEVETVKEAIRLLRERFTIRAVGIASYDPEYDPHQNTLRAGIELVETVLE